MKISKIKNINRLNSSFNKFKIIIFIFLILSICIFTSCDLDQKDIREIELSDAVFTEGSFTKSSDTDFKDNLYVYKSYSTASFTLTVKSKHDLPLESSKINWKITSTAQKITSDFKDENNVCFASTSNDNTKLYISLNFLDVLGEYVVSVSYDGGPEAKYSFRVDTTNKNTLANQLNMDYSAVSFTVKSDGNVSVNTLPGRNIVGQIRSSTPISVTEGKAVRIALSSYLTTNPFGRIKYTINSKDNDVYLIEDYGRYNINDSINKEKIGLKEITTSRNNKYGEVYLLNLSPENTITSITVNAGESLFGKKDFSIISSKYSVPSTNMNDYFTIASVPSVNGNEVLINLQGVALSNPNDYIAWVSVNGNTEKTAVYFDNSGSAKFPYNPDPAFSGQHTDTVSVYITDSYTTADTNRSEEKTITLTTNSIKKVFDIAPILTKDSSSSFLNLSNNNDSEIREDISSFTSWDDFKNKTPLKLVFTPKDITTPQDKYLYDDAYLYIVKKTNTGSVVIHRDKYIINGAVNTTPFTYEISSTTDNAEYQAYMDNIKGQVKTDNSISSYKVDVASLTGRIMIFPDGIDKTNNTAIYKVKFIAQKDDVPQKGDKTLYIQYSEDKGATWHTPIQKEDLFDAIGEENDDRGVIIRNKKSDVSFTYKSKNVLIRVMIVSNKESKGSANSYICIPSALLNGGEYLSLDSLKFAPPVSIKIQDEFYNAKTLLITRPTAKDYKVSFALASKDGNGNVNKKRPEDSYFTEIEFSKYNITIATSTSTSTSNEKKYIDINNELNNKALCKLVIDDRSLTNSQKQGSVWKNRVWCKTEDPTDKTVLPSYSYVDFDYEDCDNKINEENIVHSYFSGTTAISKSNDAGFAVYDNLSDDYEYIYTWTQKNSSIQNEQDNIKKDYPSQLRKDLITRGKWNNYKIICGCGWVISDIDPFYSQVLIAGKGKRTSKVYTSYPTNQNKWWDVKTTRIHTEPESINKYLITSPSYYKSLMLPVKK